MFERGTVVVYASKLAALAGLHKYRDADQALLDQWYFSDRQGCEAELRKRAAATEALIAGATMSPEEEAEVAAGIEQALAAPSAAALQQTLATIQDPRLQELVREEAYKARGMRDEAAALDNQAAARGVPVRARNDRLHKRPIPELGVLLMGKVDGVQGDELVEVKNRQRGFFASVPLYEQVQVQAYLWLTGLPRCRFVQCLDGERREEVLDADPAFWEGQVLPALAAAMARLRVLLGRQDASAIDRLLTGRLPDAFEPGRGKQ